jgi:hypothetical protein
LKDKITIPNPLSLWTSLTPKVKMTIVICITVIFVTAMLTGYFDEIMGLLGYEAAKK